MIGFKRSTMKRDTKTRTGEDMRTYVGTRDVEFIPLDWVERAAWWPGLQVFSRTVTLEFDLICRRSQSRDVYTPIQTVERLLKAAFSDVVPFESIDLNDHLVHGNAVAQLVER